MSHHAATDAELIQDVLNGRDAAFTALMRRHKTWLYLFVRRHVATSEDAYDVVQESFASAWAALKRYDRQRPFEIWLRRIALNKCRDRGRREAVRRRAFSLVGLSPDAVERVADTAPGAEAARIGGEALTRLNAAIAALPAKLREPLILVSIQGLSQREAAEVLGVTPKVVEMRAYRARKLLAEKLRPSDYEDLENLS
ncbi:MAG TPA: RNA polymerase sigma factor [Caulobacteraceae bacterium]|nr:RNA polymerase sigma factor [Caulobacteraceae bacterium]